MAVVTDAVSKRGQQIDYGVVADYGEKGCSTDNSGGG
jgi:hypothetical protein